MFFNNNNTHLAYEKPSYLFYDSSYVINSQEGVQQGDPLGPLLFCLSIHSIVQQLPAQLFRVFYLDDGTVGGEVREVQQALFSIEQLASEVGLTLNQSKSEVICQSDSQRGEVMSLFPEVKVIGLDNAQLLGAPIGNIISIDSSVTSKVEKLNLLGSRLGLLYRQDALLLIRNSLAIPKLVYTRRTAPCFVSQSLGNFDMSLRALLSSVLDFNLSSESIWLQATLPIGWGGLGIRTATQLASSAFLASAAGCRQLISTLLSPLQLHFCDLFWDQALECWHKESSEPPPSDDTFHIQKAWDTPIVSSNFDSLLSSFTDPVDKARFLAVSSKESGA